MMSTTLIKSSSSKKMKLRIVTRRTRMPWPEVETRGESGTITAGRKSNRIISRSGPYLRSLRTHSWRWPPSSTRSGSSKIPLRRSSAIKLTRRKCPVTMITLGHCWARSSTWRTSNCSLREIEANSTLKKEEKTCTASIQIRLICLNRMTREAVRRLQKQVAAENRTFRKRRHCWMTWSRRLDALTEKRNKTWVKNISVPCRNLALSTN